MTTDYIHVPPLKNGGIHDSGVAGLLEWNGAGQCWFSVGWAVVGRVRSLYNCYSCCIRDAFSSSFDDQMGTVIDIAIHCQCPNLCLPSRSSSPAPPTLSISLLLRYQASQRQCQGLASQQKSSTPVLILRCAFHGPSRAEMMADIISEGVLHTVLVCRSLVWWRLTSILMWRVPGRSQLKWESSSWSWWGNGECRHCHRWWGCCHGHRRGEAHSAASFEGLHGWWGLKCMQSGVPRITGCAGKI